MEIGESFFGKKKHGKLSHGRNLAPKIFPPFLTPCGPYATSKGKLLLY
jgi:hypothetical protein